ncbi:hypothetical protein, partial [Escherichia coli]|uniref:hypothetical protein n=1 Tax=Escherichia coli TaxID=562 RepID=UPI003D2F3327
RFFAIYELFQGGGGGFVVCSIFMNEKGKMSVYENFSGKSMSVLLEHNYLFLNRYTIKRNDTVII